MEGLHPGAQGRGGGVACQRRLERSGALALAITHAVNAGSTCEQSQGPDLVMGDIAAVANYTSLAGIEAFSVGFVHCNIGDTWVNTIASPTPPIWLR